MVAIEQAPAGAGAVEVEARVRLLRRVFLNREDLVAVLAGWGTPCPAEPGDLDALLRAHLLGPAAPAARVRYRLRGGGRAESGRFRVGAYCPGPDDRTRWLCLDLDAG